MVHPACTVQILILWGGGGQLSPHLIVNYLCAPKSLKKMYKTKTLFENMLKLFFRSALGFPYLHGFWHVLIFLVIIFPSI